MCQEGAMDGISEIYGLHNIPFKKYAGKIGIKENSMLFAATFLEWKILGRGGHGSMPEACKNPVPVTIDIFLELDKVVNDWNEKAKDFVCTIPQLTGGEKENIIPEYGLIRGTMRNLDGKQAEEFVAILDNIVNTIAKEKGFEVETQLDIHFFPPVMNAKKQTEVVKEVTKEFLGNDMTVDEYLPVKGSEDFSYFQQLVPGAFFFIGVDNNDDGVMIHSNKYQFDDGIIGKMSEFWWNIFKKRLNDESL